MHHYKFAISMFSRLSSRIYSSKCLLNQHQIKLGEKRAPCTLINLTLPTPTIHSFHPGRGGLSLYEGGARLFCRM